MDRTRPATNVHPSLRALSAEATAYAWAPGASLAWGDLVLVRLTPADAIPEWAVIVDGRRVESVTLSGSAEEARAVLQRVLAAHATERPGQIVSSAPCRRSHSRRDSKSGRSEATHRQNAVPWSR